MRFQLASVLFVLFIVTANAAKRLPDNFKKCKRSNPQLSECLRVNVQDALVKMKDGLPQFGILPIEPLAVNSITILQGAGSPINLKQSYTDIKLHGLSASKLTLYKPELNKYYIYCEALTPKLTFEGKYAMDGRVLVLPLTGTGKSNITMVDLKTTHELIGEPIIKKNQTYWQLTEYKTTFTPAKVYLQFDNLFNGDKALGDNMNRFLNENWEIVFNELKSGYEDTFGYVFKDITNKIFLKVPFDRIFEE